MIAFLFYIFGIALLDSINPSATTLIIIILLTGQNSIRKSVSYILGIFVSYFTIGIGIITIYNLSGVGWQLDFGLIRNFLSESSSWFLYVELIIGLALIISPWFFKPEPKKITNDKKEITSSVSLTGFFLLGASITLVELSTAFPYIGAISSLIASENNYITNTLILLVYNFIFISPTLFLVFIYWYKKNSFVAIISKIKNLFEKYYPALIKYGTVAIGFSLLVDVLLNRLIA